MDAAYDPEHQSGLQLVTARAGIDPEFRRRLLENPREAIAKTFGIELPASLRLKVIEKGPDADLVIVLPDLVDTTGELDVSDLRSVSGGSSAWNWLTGAAPDGPADSPDR